jgi:hexokinase
MHPSFVSRPSGYERGRYLALDLGGTNVRATLVELGGQRDVRVLDHQSFRLASTSGSADDLFGPVADFLAGVLSEHRADGIGYIFAFPMDQTGIRSGRLTKWTKEFAFDGVEGQDVVALMERAIRERMDKDADFRIRVLANDTVGVLAAGAYLDPRCDMGLIVGTGANLAVAVPGYMIDRRDLPAPVGSHGEMIFNMECGNFDGVDSIQTGVDWRLDAESDTSGQLMEKMIAGRYLGEVARLRVMEAASKGERFVEWLDEKGDFAAPYSFTTEQLSDIIFDDSQDLTATAMELGRLGVAISALDERRHLKEICVSVARRSAHIVAASIAATATYIDPGLKNEHMVAVDGSVFRGIPGYREEVERGLAQTLGESADRIQVCYLRDGSGLGAAVVAAVAAGLE